MLRGLEIGDGGAIYGGVGKWGRECGSGYGGERDTLFVMYRVQMLRI